MCALQASPPVTPRPASAARGRPPLHAGERRRILAATTAVFLERGFARAGTNEIARRAQTSKQTLYSLFPSKADLFAGVIDAYTQQLFAQHRYHIESAVPPRQALIEIGDSVLALFNDPSFVALYRIIVGEAGNFPELSRRLWSGCADRGYGLLADYLRSQRLGGPRYRDSAIQFISLVLGDFLLNAILNPALRPSTRQNRARVRRAVADFLLLHPRHAGS